MTVPAAEGFYMPAEWQPHARCWMAWPCREEIWDGRIEDTRQAYAEVARAIAEFEPVTMVANHTDVAAASLACGRGVEILPMDIDDSWMRDVGPTYVVDGKGGIAGCDWHFNAWGHVYEFYNNDARLAEALLAHQEIRRLDAPFVLEGGAVHTDGEGTLLTTENVVLNPNRGSEPSKSEAEKIFRDWLGSERVIWLDKALEVDATDGHVDNLACFARPGVVEVEPDDGAYNLSLAEGTVPQAVLRALLDRGAEVQAFEVAPVPLEDIFVAAVGGKEA